ncbi:MAG TPA: helix-turn-helix domain-containing protein [Pyrinomonadaceae bacterium]
MQTESLIIIPATPQPASEGQLLNTKLANINSLVSSLNAAVEDLSAIELPPIDDHFDFYHEVEQFEINLIQSALRITGGSQVKAARLLKLNTTTLNAKLKLFKISTRQGESC